MATGSATCLGTAELTPSSCSVLGWDRDTGCGIWVGRAALHPACLSFPIGSGRAVGTVGAEGRGVHCLQRGAAGRRGVGQEVGRRHEALPCAGCGIGSALVPCTAWTQRFPSVLSALSGAVSVGHKAPLLPPSLHTSVSPQVTTLPGSPAAHPHPPQAPHTTAPSNAPSSFRDPPDPRLLLPEAAHSPPCGPMASHRDQSSTGPASQ